MFSRRVLLGAAAAFALPAARAQQRNAPPPASTPPASTLLTAQDRQDVTRVERYLNEMKTLTARFVQISEQGGVAEGRIYLQRPGRLRLDYADPVPLLVIAARGQIVQHDKQLKQTTYLPISSTPAGILLRETVTLSGSVTVTAVERGPGSLRISLVQSDDPRAGRLTLVFVDAPLQLATWVVVDSQGATTRVALSEIQNGTQIDPRLFEFREEAPTRGN